MYWNSRRKDILSKKGGDQSMPLSMDVHKNVEGLTREGIEEAHKKDLAVQEQTSPYHHPHMFRFCVAETTAL
jgi:hypothetical protein